MPTLAIEIADAALDAAVGDALVASSPGIALLDPAGITVGAAAAASARLKPLLVMDRFWSGLSTQPLARALPEARTPADLAWLHVRQLHAQAGADADAVILAVPSSWREAELGLVAGIAGAAGLPLGGIVDSAVAGCAGLEAGYRVLHLDVDLHQSTLVALEGEQTLVRREVGVATRVGLRALMGACAQVVGESMVRRTRFDPLHQAASEQALHDALPGWLESVAATGRTEAALDFGGRRFAVELHRDECTLAAEAWYTQLADLVATTARGEPVTLVMTRRAAMLPGLAERLARAAGSAPVALPAGAAAFGALAHGSAIRSDGALALVTGLPRSCPAARPVQPAGGARATHLVHGGVAHTLEAEPLVIGSDPAAPRMLRLPAQLPGVSRRHCSVLLGAHGAIVRDHSRHGTFVNGQRVNGDAPLAAGDRLRVGSPGVVFELVAVN